MFRQGGGPVRHVGREPESLSDSNQTAGDCVFFPCRVLFLLLIRDINYALGLVVGCVFSTFSFIVIRGTAIAT